MATRGSRSRCGSRRPRLSAANPALGVAHAPTDSFCSSVSQRRPTCPKVWHTRLPLPARRDRELVAAIVPRGVVPELVAANPPHGVAHAPTDSFCSPCESSAADLPGGVAHAPSAAGAAPVAAPVASLSSFFGEAQTTEPKRPTPVILDIHIILEPANQNIYGFIWFLVSCAGFSDYFG